MPSPKQESNRSIADRVEAIDRALKVKELAALLRCSATNIYNLAREGRLGSGMVIRFGGTIRLDPQGTAEWLRRQGLGE